MPVYSAAFAAFAPENVTPAALFLVALAAMQGLLVAAALSVILKPRHSRSTVSHAASVSALAPSGPPVAESPRNYHAPSASSAESAAPATPSAESGTPDESGRSAPNCQEAFGQTQVKAGEYPGAAYGQVREANRALVRGDLDGAQTALCKAVLWNRTNPALPLELAQLMLLRRDGAKAVEWANKGLALDPASTRGQGILGDGLARLGEYEPARRAWLASMRLTPNGDPEQFKALSFSSVREARASLKRKDHARAERFFRRGVVLDENNVAACTGLADTLLKLGDASSALRWANRAIALAPRDPFARVTLGDVLLQRGDRGAAEVEWREALQLDPSNFAAKLRINRLSNAR